MAISPRYSWPLPDLPDAPNIPYDMNQLAVGIEGTIHLNGPPSAQVRVSAGASPAQPATTWVPITCDVFTSGLPELYEVSGGGIKVLQTGTYQILATLLIGAGSVSAFSMGVSFDANPPYRAFASVSPAGTLVNPILHGSTLTAVTANTTVKMWGWGATAGWTFIDQSRLELVRVT